MIIENERGPKRGERDFGRGGRASGAARLAGGIGGVVDVHMRRVSPVLLLQREWVAIDRLCVREEENKITHRELRTVGPWSCTARRHEPAISYSTPA